MRSVETKGVAWSVPVCVCWSHSWAVQQRMNWLSLEMSFGSDSGGPKEPCIRWVQIHHVKRQFLGVVQPIEKKTLYITAAYQNKIINGINVNAVLPTALLPTGRCYVNFSAWTIRRCDAACRQNCLTTCLSLHHKHIRWTDFLSLSFPLLPSPPLFSLLLLYLYPSPPLPFLISSTP